MAKKRTKMMEEILARPETAKAAAK